MSGDGTATGVDAARLAGLLATYADYMIVIADRDLRVVGIGGVAAVGAPSSASATELFPGHVEEVVAACRAALAGERHMAELAGAHLLLEAAPLRWEGDRVEEVVVILRDISIIRDEQRLRRYSDRQYRAAFERAPVAMVHVDRAGRCQVANAAMASMLGRGTDDVHGRLLADLVHPDDRARVASAVEAMGEGSLPWYRSEDRFEHVDGPMVYVSATAAPIEVEDGQVSHILFHLVDVTDQRELELQLRAMVDEDPLTGLRNRRSFEAALNAQSSRVAHYGARGAILVLDIDRFKEINDLFGHRAGDELITQFADVLRANLRGADVIARTGGDEFAVILPDANPDQAEQVAAKLVEAIRTRCQTVLGGRTRPVTTSIGVAAFVRQESNGAELLMQADMAMYEAKHAGRDRYAVYRAQGQAESGLAMRGKLVERIEEALVGSHFDLDAQRIVDLRTGAARDHELLLRLKDGVNSLQPAAFIGVAEQAGLLGRVDRWVLGAAINLLLSPGLDPHVRLCVNTSASALAADETLALLEERFAAEPSLAGRLVIEVPERSLAAHLTDAAPLGERLHRLGISLSLDDFHAGLGAFADLREMPFDQVKIDGQIIRRCLRSPADRLVVRALVDVAHGLGKQVVAEHVEDEETVDFLVEEGVDLAQGHHFGAPVPSSQLAGQQ